MSNEVKRNVIGSQRRSFLADLAEGIELDFCENLPRTDVLLIIEEHEITVSFNDYGIFFDGMLHYDRGKFHIYCNIGGRNSTSEGRRRFTLGHELGHFFIPEHHAALRNGLAPHHPSFCSHENSGVYVELEADFFASRLLMSDRRLTPMVCRARIDLNIVQQIARDLGTSLLSTVVRVCEATECPCAFLVWRDAKNPWFSISRGFRELGLSFLKTSPEEVVQPNTATWLAFGDRASGSNRIFSSASVASFWFGRGSPGTIAELMLTEEAVRTSYGVITWLTVNPCDMNAVKAVLAGKR